jgi:DNA invertase Pin-like site-specific DNA recombinase
MLIPIGRMIGVGGIYTWRRGAEILYIGQSTNLLQRLGNHHVIRPSALQPEDTLEIKFVEDRNERLRLESMLIRAHKPLYNSEVSTWRVNPRDKAKMESSAQLTARAQALNAEGLPPLRIADELGVSPGLVYRMIRGYVSRMIDPTKLRARKRYYKPRPDRRSERKEQMKTMRADGSTFAEIAKQFNITRQAVHQICNC